MDTGHAASDTARLMEPMLVRWLIQTRAWRGRRLLLEPILYAARYARRSARAEGIHRMADALVRDFFAEWQPAFRVKQFEVKILLWVFLAVIVGLIGFGLAAR